MDYYLQYYIGNQYEIDQGIDGNKERLYLDGDAYSASSVYIKEGTTWKVYYILRDYLGSITQITDDKGILKDELSYDPWGRLRDPKNHQIYKRDAIPKLLLGRGYTGHEHLTEYSLINMNARLYDPMLGRFLSPDPYIQAPFMSQNFNRYSYVLNNPLKYTDENGEFIHLIIGGVVGGLINWGLHGFKWDVSGLAAFGIGTVSGVVAAGTFGVGLAASGVAGAGFTSLGAMSGAGALASGAAGMFSYVASTPILTGGNHLVFGDPLPTIKEYIEGLAFSTISSAFSGALQAKAAGNNVLTGKSSQQIFDTQVENIAKGASQPMSAANDIDDVLFERVGNKTVDSYLKKQSMLPQPYYPIDNGATSAGWRGTVLNVNSTFDRYGSNFGTFAGEVGTPIPMRALPPGNNGNYNMYRVIKPLPVMKSTIAPAFGQVGGGIQYKLPMNIQDLLDAGYIVKY